MSTIHLLQIVAAILLLGDGASQEPALRPPMVLSQPEWIVPEGVRSSANPDDQFKVVLNLMIDHNGEVENVGISESSGNEVLDQYAQRNAQQMRFTLQLSNGKPVATRATLPIIFFMKQ